MSTTEVAPNKERSQFVQVRASMFMDVLRYTALSEEELKNCKAQTGKDYKIIPWDDKDGYHEIVLNDRFMKGLRNISLGLYRDLVNAGEKELADRIVERNKEETRKTAEIERS